MAYFSAAIAGLCLFFGAAEAALAGVFIIETYYNLKGH